jgi:hypothetical protein
MAPRYFKNFLIFCFATIRRNSKYRTHLYNNFGSPQVHPRKRYTKSNIGIGTPNNQSKIHPTFPFSVLRITILTFFQTWDFLLFLNCHFQ